MLQYFFFFYFRGIYMSFETKRKSKKFTEIEEITKQFQITSHRLKLPCFLFQLLRSSPQCSARVQLKVGNFELTYGSFFSSLLCLCTAVITDVAETAARFTESQN